MKQSRLITSPNTVLANALISTIDILRSKIAYCNPEEIVFVVGTQINGAPHIGTHLVQATSFLLAHEVRHTFSIDTKVKFGALDNAPYEVKADPFSFRPYQLNYYQKFGEQKIRNLVNDYYFDFFEGLSERTSIEYTVETYTDQQKSEVFRSAFIDTVNELENIKWYLSPSSGKPHVRLPCPKCGFSEKFAEKTKVLSKSQNEIVFNSVCFEHGSYNSSITKGNKVYFDLNTLYRNVVKESVLKFDGKTLNVMIKGGDWVFGCQLVDQALSVLGHKKVDLPLRIFAPQIIVETGAKLSKSLIKRKEMKLEGEENLWMLDTSKKHEDNDIYIDELLTLVDNLLSEPKHFFRSYTYKEIDRIMKNQVVKNRKNTRFMRIYRKYFKLIQDGRKKIEVRVGYSSMRNIKTGQFINFVCQNEECLTRVTNIKEYRSFKEMFENEVASEINPDLPTVQQLEEISKIFPPHKEKLRVLAIHIEKVF